MILGIIETTNHKAMHTHQKESSLTMQGFQCFTWNGLYKVLFNKTIHNNLVRESLVLLNPQELFYVGHSTAKYTNSV